MGLTAMAMGVASQAANVMGQRQQAKAQEASQKAASVREMRRFQLSQRAERQQQADADTAMAVERQKANREAESGISTSIVAAEESGVAGTSVGLAVNEFAQKNAEYQAALSLQERMNVVAQRLSFENAGSDYVNRMTGINKPIQKPDYLGAALGIGATVAKGLGDYQQKKAGEETRNQQSTLMGLQIDNQRASLDASRQGLSNAGAAYSAAQGATATATATSALNSAKLYRQR